MKRIAISLGSLSLIIMQQGYSNPVSMVESPSASSSNIVAEETTLPLQEDSDPFAFSEISLQELEEELLSLEKELEFEQNRETLEGNSVALRQASPENLSLSNEPLQDEASLDPILETVSMESLEDSPLNLTMQEIQASLQHQESNLTNNTLLINEEIAIDPTDNQEPINLSTSPTEQISNPIETELLLEPSEDANPISEEVKESLKKPISISLTQVFSGSPLIYLTLLGLSTISVALWLFNFMTLNKYAITNVSVMKEIKNKLISNQFDHVIALCNEKGCFFSKIMAAGVNSRRYGLQFMLESMKSEGKRTSVSFWQRLNLLHDIAIIAPMIGLLGTVLGMFYAFYDLNRSFESISSLFDGLGISVGTTVAGIFVAILAMILHSASKYRLVKSLTFVESEAVALAHLIDSNKNS
ncbi:MAG: MotA/TolQ/ExbB proton channel family protein [Chlamydiae bacterium]|nr:MotA/TolQ/ExbB proton channel family protein [Chlamydiota bacterium]